MRNCRTCNRVGEKKPYRSQDAQLTLHGRGHWNGILITVCLLVLKINLLTLLKVKRKQSTTLLKHYLLAYVGHGFKIMNLKAKIRWSTPRG